MASKKASGANIPEAARHTVAVKVRLRPETAANVKALAKRWGCPVSYVVEVMAVVTGRAFAGKPTPADEFEEILTGLYERDEAAE